MSSVVTGTGDSGLTGLFGGGRISKASIRVHTYGSVDELNAMLAVIIASYDIDRTLHIGLLERIGKIHFLLYRIGADFATPMDSKATVDRVGDSEVEEIEKWIKEIENALPPQTEFIIPGGSQLSAMLHITCSITRRAERFAVELSEKEDMNEKAIIFLNRLSDFFFVAARFVNQMLDEKELNVKDAARFMI